MTTPSRKTAKEKTENLGLKTTNERTALNKYFDTFISARYLYTNLIAEMDQFHRKFETQNGQFNQCKQLVQRLGFPTTEIASTTRESLVLLIDICREFGNFKKKSDTYLIALNEKHTNWYNYGRLLDKLSFEFDTKTEKELYLLLQKDERFIEFDTRMCYWENNTALLDEWKILKTSLEEKLSQYCQVFEEVCQRYAIRNIPALPDDKPPESSLEDDDDDVQFGAVILPLAKMNLEKKKQPIKKRHPKVEEQKQS